MNKTRARVREDRDSLQNNRTSITNARGRGADLESKRVVEVTRRGGIALGRDPAATNRLIRWIYDGWRGEIGSRPRVNLARVKAGERGYGRYVVKRRTPDRFPTGFMPLFFIRLEDAG